MVSEHSFRYTSAFSRHFRVALTGLLGEPLFGDFAECVAASGSGNLTKPALHARIGTVGDQFAVRIAGFTRFNKGDGRLSPQREQLLLFSKTDTTTARACCRSAEPADEVHCSRRTCRRGHAVSTDGCEGR
jgi:hypothetical protein